MHTPVFDKTGAHQGAFMPSLLKGLTLRQYQKVYYCGTEWTYIETIDGKYLLRSANRNIDDILADPEFVNPFIDDGRANDGN